MPDIAVQERGTDTGNFALRITDTTPAPATAEDTTTAPTALADTTDLDDIATSGR